MLNYSRLIKVVQEVVQIGGKLLNAVRGRCFRRCLLQPGFHRRRRDLSLQRGLFRLGQVNAPLFTNLLEMPVNVVNQLIGGPADGFQTGFQLRQRFFAAPPGNIAKAILAGLEAEVLTDGIGYAFRLHFLSIAVLWLCFLLRSGGGRQPVLFLQMQHGMGNLVDGRAHCLHLSHTLFDSNVPCVQVQKPVHALFPNGIDGDGHRRSPPQGLHENLIILHFARQGTGQLRQGLALGLGHVKDLYRAKQGDFDFFLLHDNISIMV